MNFFLDLHTRYAPEMTPREFSDVINEVERVLFDRHPEYLQLQEQEQNHHVEEEYRRIHAH